SLEAQLSDFQSQKPRNGVAVDPNTRFPNIERAKKAIGEAVEQDGRIQAKQPEIGAKRTAAAVSRG
ncbi:hypothetical protein K432DRAFT_312187, partial [Lepidopterella palustris CBS 459.81]